MLEVSQRTEHVRSLLVLGVATALGIWTPAFRLAQPTRASGRHPAAAADRAYAELRSRVRPGERIGIICASGDPDSDGALWYSAQYALAPALVEPVYLSHCLDPRLGDRCRIDTVDRVAFLAPDPRSAAFVQVRLGLAPVGAAGDALLLERRRP